MDSVGKINNHICTFLGIDVCIALFTVICLHFNKVLDYILNVFMNKIETYSTVKIYVIWICKIVDPIFKW